VSDTPSIDQPTPAAPASRASLLQQWRQQRAARPTVELQRNDASGPLPLSFAQERLWFLHQMQPSSPGYNLPIALRLHGALDVAALGRSFDALIARHATLRTTFHEVGGKPVQQIQPALSFALTEIDLRSLPPAVREQQLALQTRAQFEQPFDLERGPLLRAALFALADEQHLLLITLHHIITDGWSNGILVDELGRLYAAQIDPSVAPLPELPYQYADLAAYERARFAAGLLDNDLAYWKQQLSGPLPVLNLPLDHPRPAVQTTAGATHHVTLPAAILPELQQLCQQEGATLVMTLLAVFNTLLYRYTGQDDLLIGVPVFNRQRSESERLIGLFVNTLVIRSSLAGNPSFRELLQRVRTASLQAYERQSYPFEKLVEALQPERDTSHTPIFQAMLSVAAGAETEQSWPGLRLQPYDVDRPGANFDLTLEVIEQPDGLHCALVYRTDLFEPATIARLAQHFGQLLQACVQQPDQPIERLPLLSAAERRQIVEQWNATKVEFPQTHVLHRLVEQQAARTPEAIAVTYAEQQLSYAELNARANQLAHALIARGVTPGSLVGIAVERSLELVIGLLGILKAGGAYVPLDPSYPRERLAYMLSDANVPVLLTQAHLMGELPAAQAASICLDRDWPAIAVYSAANPEIARTPDDLAYMIYTSGSTGQPKGALNTHRGIANRLLWMQAEYGLRADDRVLQKTPFSFDVSVWEFFWPLIVGARLVVARPEGHKDAAYLAQLIADAGVTTVHFVPSMLQIFLEEPGVARCTSLKRVICSGEALSYELQQRFFERSAAELHNLYGPTEVAVDVSYWACQRDSARRSVPIGRPVANTQLYILDRQLQPVPIGVAGELHIGGVQVGLGYLNRPELTAEKFIDDPFTPGGRLYKTGDLARFLPDGVIDYLGRIDGQVKLRGLRIELGEIEATLQQHPAVREAVVVVKQVAAGDQRLTAYVVAEQEPENKGTGEQGNKGLDADPSALAQGAPLQASALRVFLATKLPEYMIPGVFVTLDALPLSPSGKVDRKALPNPELSGSDAERQFVAPKDDIERVIAEIWQETLGVARVGTQDNFFELGGHSLLVTQVRAKIQERLNHDLSIVDAFRLTTVQALAQHIGRGKTEQPAVQAIMSRAELQRQAMNRRRTERR
jgi:amino acid adenylation domain-containing protein